jgi:hypothetical protein
VSYVALLETLVVLIGVVIENLVKAGQANIVVEHLKILQEKVNKANEARKNSIANDDASGLLSDDGHKRD